MCLATRCVEMHNVSYGARFLSTYDVIRPLARLQRLMWMSRPGISVCEDGIEVYTYIHILNYVLHYYLLMHVMCIYILYFQTYTIYT